MGSIYSAVECPQCACSATEDYYYKSNEKYIWCYRCGYSYENIIEEWEDANIPIYKKTIHEGHGMCVVVKKGGKGKRIILNSAPTEKQIEKYLNYFEDSDVDVEKSYLVIFENNEFKTIAGVSPDNFYLPFESYKEDEREVIVPVNSLGI